MSASWSMFIIAGTVVSLLGLLWLLLSNRSAPSGEIGESVGHDFDGIEELDTPLPRWWVWMFLGTIAFAVAYLVWYPGLGNFAGLSGWTSAAQVEAQARAHEARYAELYARLAALDPQAAAQDRQAVNIGRRLFLNNCATCHGVTGEGAFGFPNLTDDEWLWGGDVATIRETVRLGRQGVMPPWGAALTDDQIHQVALHVRHLASGGAEPDSDDGRERFALLCAACHGRDGAPVLPGVPDLRNDLWLYGGDLATIEFTIRNGRNGVMPAQEGKLNPAQIAIVANYVKNLSAAAEAN